MSDRRERELVLAPNEYAYILDTTKGHINCYVGPNKTSLAQTDQPVVFNAEAGRFEYTELSVAVQLFATAPANWYLVLDNPAPDNAHPRTGVASSLIELRIGRKIVVPGPVSFALWPGQTARVIAGHTLRSNEYLLVAVYDADEAARHWASALGLESEPREGAEKLSFAVGERRVIRGTEVKFYVPPSGVEVLPDRNGRYVREAVTLGRLEHCVLLGDDGRKEFIRGEAVVFPSANQRFLERDGQTKFPAIELSDTTGLHIKVISPYTDPDGTEHREGEELFLTGKGVIYFPRDEHALVRHAGGELHRALAIPKGEGCYVLDRVSGETHLRQGPCMLLPDPRAESVLQRVLSDREVRLLYPGNEDALQWNRRLRAGGPRAVGQGAGQHAELGRFEGAVRVDVWSGYAVEVVNRGGKRRVVRGPTSILLDHDERLQHLSLSTGTPKSDERMLETVFLQVAGNKVSDCFELITRDLVAARLRLTYRVVFEGSPERWFAVDNYVKLLCEHVSSILKARLRQLSIREVQSEVPRFVRDAVLGEKPEQGARPGRVFEENGMRVYDVEVLELEIVDETVRELLTDAQAEAIEQAIEVAARETGMAKDLRIEQIERAIAEERHHTELLRVQLASERAERLQAEAEAERQRRARVEELDATLRRATHALELELARAEFEARMSRQGAELEQRRGAQALELEALSARVEGAVAAARAFDPHLIQAIHRLGDQQLLASLAENFGELAAIEGQGLLQTARRFLDFVPSTLVPALREEPPVAQ